jgi:hypothetical protein
MTLLLAKSCLLVSFAKAFQLNFRSKMSTTRFSSEGHELVLDKFCARQFNNPDYTGTQIQYPEDGFEMKVNEYFKSGYPLVDGYAPFW